MGCTRICGDSCDHIKPENNVNDVDIAHKDVVDFANFKLDKFDSMETIVNTVISKFTKSKFGGIIEKENAVGEVSEFAKSKF